MTEENKTLTPETVLKIKFINENKKSKQKILYFKASNSSKKLTLNTFIKKEKN